MAAVEDLKGLHFMTWLSASRPEKQTWCPTQERGGTDLKLSASQGWPVTLASTRQAEAGGVLPVRENSLGDIMRSGVAWGCLRKEKGVRRGREMVGKGSMKTED